MPGFNGTGPIGQGSRTGWGRGYCNPSNTAPNTPVNSGYGLGLGMRRGFGGGSFARGCRGLGRRGAGFGFGASPYAYNVNADDELAILKQQAEAAKNNLDSISARIAELEKSKD